jgi:hypothetical protein
VYRAVQVAIEEGNLAFIYHIRVTYDTGYNVCFV